MDEHQPNDLERRSAPPRCPRCTRSPRDAEDRLNWATIDDAEVCPGCLTMNDVERLRDDGR
jgi:hypothetical protein